jgi:hypothetical protein
VLAEVVTISDGVLDVEVVVGMDEVVEVVVGMDEVVEVVDVLVLLLVLLLVVLVVLSLV